MQTRLLQINPTALKLLDLNARFMRGEVFARLVANIAQDGKLTSIPFAWALHDDATQKPVLKDGVAVYEVLSGNHRVQAAVKAGLKEIDVMVTDDYLNPDQRIAIQLSHNELVGEDDPAILKQLYMKIVAPTMRVYSGLDDKKLELLKGVEIGSLSEINLTFQTISLLFLPHEVEQIHEVWDKAKQAAKGKIKWLANRADYDKALDALEMVGEAYAVKNVATALLIVLDVFGRHLDDLAEGWYDQESGEALTGTRAVPNVPLESVFGARTLKAKQAATIKTALDKLVNDGDADTPFEALEKLIAEHHS